MFSLELFSLSDMSACAATLRQLGRGERSMEGVAGNIVRHLFENLVDGRTGARACALVRFFKTHPYNGLDVGLQRVAREMLGRPPDSPVLKCLTLLATAGERSEWNDRSRSQEHRAIPLHGEIVLQRVPVIGHLLGQLGMEAGAILRREPADLLDLEERSYAVLHVPRARGSPLVPSQEEFVTPLGIESVLSCGGVLPSGDIFAVVLFSRVPIPQATVDLFKPLALSIKLAVLPFDCGPVFAPAGSVAAGRGEFTGGDRLSDGSWRSRSREATLEQLLEIHERTALQQAGALKQAGEEPRLANEELERQIRQRTEELVRANEALSEEIRERRKVDRARWALSRCSQALLRAGDEPQFLRELCRVIVEVAGYRLCWVGYAERDQAKTVRPVAHAGYEDGYLETVNVTWANTERGRGPVGTAIRTCKPAVFRDVTHDPDFDPWRAEALRRGYASVIGIPLLSGSEVVGALAIYAAERDAFDDDEVQLLGELADDLSYGIGALRTRAAHHRAEEALKRANDELEHRVEERTAELSRTNTLLRREIADRERAETALRSSERLYRQLTEGILEAIVVADEQGRIKLFNPTAQRVFGYEEREVLGQPLTLLMPREDLDAHEQALRRYVETREAHGIGSTTERQGRRKSGEIFPLEISLSAIELPEGIIFLGAIHDLTDRRRMQSMIVQAEKLASLGLLSAGVAHEINNPLSYVANNLAMLERDVHGLLQVLDVCEGAHPELARQIDQIGEAIDLPYIRANLGRLISSTRQGVRRISGIVENLREFARLDQAVVDRVDLHQAIASSLELIRYQLGRCHITVEQHEGELLSVVCAPAQINQVVLNLLVNAMQAIEATGRSDGRIEIETRAHGNEVILEVADNGCGIPEENLPRIFDPFFTTKPVGQGTGLGLAISHSIVADHGGRVEVESTPGRGSRFRVILPVGGKGQGRKQAGQALSTGEGRPSRDQQPASGPPR